MSIARTGSDSIEGPGIILSAVMAGVALFIALSSQIAVAMGWIKPVEPEEPSAEDTDAAPSDLDASALKELAEPTSLEAVLKAAAPEEAPVTISIVDEAFEDTGHVTGSEQSTGSWAVGVESPRGALVQGMCRKVSVIPLPEGVSCKDEWLRPLGSEGGGVEAHKVACLSAAGHVRILNSQKALKNVPPKASPIVVGKSASPGKASSITPSGDEASTAHANAGSSGNFKPAWAAGTFKGRL